MVFLVISHSRVLLLFYCFHPMGGYGVPVSRALVDLIGERWYDMVGGAEMIEYATRTMYFQA